MKESSLTSNAEDRQIQLHKGDKQPLSQQLKMLLIMDPERIRGQIIVD